MRFTTARHRQVPDRLRITSRDFSQTLHWLVHHLAADIPVAEVISLAADSGASLIVLSSATSGAVRLASGETREIRERLPNTRVLAGRPGDTLGRLRELARASQDPGGQ